MNCVGCGPINFTVSARVYFLMNVCETCAEHSLAMVKGVWQTDAKKSRAL